MKIDNEPAYGMDVCDRCVNFGQLSRILIGQKQWDLCEECLEGLEHYLRGWNCGDHR